MGTIGIDENNNGMVNGGYGQYNYNNGYAQGGASDFGRKAGTVGVEDSLLAGSRYLRQITACQKTGSYGLMDWMGRRLWNR